MRGKEVFYPMGWDDNGLPTERRVQNYYGVRCDPSLPYDPDFTAAGQARPEAAGADQPAATSSSCASELTDEDEKAFEGCGAGSGCRVDWSQPLHDHRRDDSQPSSQRAFLRNLARGEAYLAEAPTLWDVTFRTAVAQAELEDRELPRRLPPGRRSTAPTAAARSTSTPPGRSCCRPASRWSPTPTTSATSRCSARRSRTPLFGVEVPVLRAPAGRPDKGTGIAMFCTFGDLTDVTWWRELQLPTRVIIGRDGRLLPRDRRTGSPTPVATAYAELAGKTAFTRPRGRGRDCCASPATWSASRRRPQRMVKFYEKGDKPLEIVTTRQWYIRNGGRDAELAQAFARRAARELRWVPPHMRHRYEQLGRAGSTATG